VDPATLDVFEVKDGLELGVSPCFDSLDRRA
jgi:hypothetical protein